MPHPYSDTHKILAEPWSDFSLDLPLVGIDHPVTPSGLLTYLRRFSPSLVGKAKKYSLLEIESVIFLIELLIVSSNLCIY